MKAFVLGLFPVLASLSATARPVPPWMLLPRVRRAARIAALLPRLGRLVARHVAMEAQDMHDDVLRHLGRLPFLIFALRDSDTLKKGLHNPKRRQPGEISMPSARGSSFIDAAKGLAPRIQAAAPEIEQSRRLPLPLVEAMAQAGLFRLWIPRSLGGEEADPMTLARVVEEVSRADGAAGWCMAIGGEYAALSGYLPAEAVREIYGSDPHVRTAGALRPTGDAVVEDGGYRVTGRWPLGSGCQHSSWIVGGCRILDGEQPRLRPDGSPVTRILFFPATDCEILDTWHSIGLRGTGSHDYAVADVFVPAARALSFRDPPVEPGPLYAIPTIALFATVLAAVPLGIARHAIDIVRDLARTKIAIRSRRGLNEDATMQVNLGIAEATLRSARAFLYETLEKTWEAVSSGQELGIEQRAMLWLASTHAATAAKQAAELMFSAGGATSPYASAGIERCVRDIHAAGQHLTLAPPNYQMAGQAFLDLDMRTTPLLSMDDRR